MKVPRFAVLKIKNGLSGQQECTASKQWDQIKLKRVLRLWNIINEKHGGFLRHQLKIACRKPRQCRVQQVFEKGQKKKVKLFS